MPLLQNAWHAKRGRVARCFIVPGFQGFISPVEQKALSSAAPIPDCGRPAPP